MPSHRRYDHRKLAFKQVNRRKRNKKVSISLDDLDSTINPRKQSADIYGGYLGKSRENAPLSKIHEQEEREQRKVTFKKKKDTNESQHDDQSLNDPNEATANYLGTDNLDLKAFSDITSFFQSLQQSQQFDLSQLASVLEHKVGVNSLDNIMSHLEEKQVKRQKEKLEEELQDIKERTTKILSDYRGDESEEGVVEEFDMRILTDPDCFNKENNELSMMRHGIENILDTYAVVCQEREDVLSEIFVALENDNIDENLLDLPPNEADDFTSEITMTIEKINYKKAKLNKLFYKLIHLAANMHGSKDGKIVRERNIQENVVGKFKKLQENRNERKETADTWKYAANEIVDLLQAVRKEGATDVERIEREFGILMEAVTSQKNYVVECEDRLNVQQVAIQKTEVIKEKIRQENHLLQEELDQCRLTLKAMQMKSEKLESQVQQLTNDKRKTNEQLTQLKVSDGKELTDLSVKVEMLEKQVSRYEKELEKEKLKVIELENFQKTETIDISNTNNIKQVEPQKIFGTVDKIPAVEQTPCKKCNVHKKKIDALRLELHEVTQENLGIKNEMTNLRESMKFDKEQSAKIPDTSDESVDEPTLPTDEDARHVDNSESSGNCAVNKSDSNDDVIQMFKSNGLSQEEQHSTSQTNFDSNDDVIQIFKSNRLSQEEQHSTSQTNLPNTPEVVKTSAVARIEEIEQQKKSMCDAFTQVDFPLKPEIKSDVQKIKQIAPRHRRNSISVNLDTHTSEIAAKIFGIAKVAVNMSKFRANVLKLMAINKLNANKGISDGQIALESNEPEHEDNTPQTKMLTPVSEILSSTGSESTNQNDGSIMAGNLKKQERVEMTRSTVTQSADFEAQVNKTPDMEGFVSTAGSKSTEGSMTKTEYQAEVSNHKTGNKVHKDAMSSSFTIGEEYSSPDHPRSDLKAIEQIPSNQDREGLRRSWTESGFFDNMDESSNNQNPTSSEGPKQDPRKHVLKFLKNIARHKCSHLKEELEMLSLEKMSKDEAVSQELNVFAQHAVDILHILSFVAERVSKTDMSESHQDYQESTLSKLNTTWQPFVLISDEDNDKVGIQRQNRKMSVGEEHFNNRMKIIERPQRNIKEQPFHSDTQSLQPPYLAQSTTSVQHMEPAELGESRKIAKVAEKKRQRLLKRHKKLVERLRGSGASTKHIYTILGIPSRPGEGESNEHIDLKLPVHRRGRRISLVGHSFRNSEHTAKDSISVLPQVHRAVNYENDTKTVLHHNFNHKSAQFSASLRSKGHTQPLIPGRNRTVFPPLNLKGASTPISLNFFKTKPLSSYKAYNRGK